MAKYIVIKSIFVDAGDGTVKKIPRLNADGERNSCELSAEDAKPFIKAKAIEKVA